MALYRVIGTVSTTLYTLVEANSPEEARKVAESRPSCTIINPSCIEDSPNTAWRFSKAGGDISQSINGIEIVRN